MRDDVFDPITERVHREGEQLRRRILWSTLVAVVITLFFILVSWQSVARAREQLAQIETKVQALRADSVRLDQLQQARAQDMSRNDSLTALAAALKDTINRTFPTGKADRIEQAAARQYVANVKPRVYIHIGETTQRAAARDVQRRLEQAGFVVPGIERVSQATRTSEVRFFKSDERPDAERIRDIVQGVVSLAVVDLSTRYGRSTLIRAGHYEIWFGPEFGR